MESLYLIADLNTAHTLNAAACVPDKRKIAVGLVAFNARFINISENIKVVCNLLKLTGAAAHAGCAVAVVLAEYELNVNVPCLAHARTVCENNHAVLGLGVAGGNKALVVLDFNNADAARAYFVELFEVAKGRNMYIGFFCRVKNGCAVLNLNGNIINCKLYHWNILPPFSAP